MADMAGQLFVRTIEVPESTRRLANDDVPAFLQMQFTEAVESFASRGIVDPETFQRLTDAARTRAFSATRLFTDGLRQRAYERLLAALQEGSTLTEFAAGIRNEQVSLGVTPSSPAYLETVFRTNVQTAYGAGRLRQITDPAVMEARPFVEYRTVGDSRVRASHQELDGKVFRSSDEAWRSVAPPNGFSCRCSTVTLESPEGREVLSAPPVQADKGFNAPPTDLLEAPI